jgi:hypothetical protein
MKDIMMFSYPVFADFPILEPIPEGAKRRGGFPPESPKGGITGAFIIGRVLLKMRRMDKT